jgi:hypothetical protein
MWLRCGVQRGLAIYFFEQRTRGLPKALARAVSSLAQAQWLASASLEKVPVRRSSAVATLLDMISPLDCEQQVIADRKHLEDLKKVHVGVSPYWDEHPHYILTRICELDGFPRADDPPWQLNRTARSPVLTRRLRNAIFHPWSYFSPINQKFHPSLDLRAHCAPSRERRAGRATHRIAGVGCVPRANRKRDGRSSSLTHQLATPPQFIRRLPASMMRSERPAAPRWTSRRTRSRLVRAPRMRRWTPSPRRRNAIGRGCLFHRDVEAPAERAQRLRKQRQLGRMARALGTIRCARRCAAAGATVAR